MHIATLLLTTVSSISDYAFEFVTNRELTETGGWKALRNMELAAHDFLLVETQFKTEIIPRKAEVMAARLSKALAPLFPESSIHRGQAGFESWGQARDVSADRQFRLKTLFDAILNLKLRTVTTTESYEIVIYPPGTLSTDGGESDQRSWLLASIYTYPSDITKMTREIEDALVQPNNFIAKSESERSLMSAQKTDLTVPKLETRFSCDSVTSEYPDRENEGLMPEASQEPYQTFTDAEVLKDPMQAKQHIQSETDEGPIVPIERSSNISANTEARDMDEMQGGEVGDKASESTSMSKVNSPLPTPKDPSVEKVANSSAASGDETVETQSGRGLQETDTCVTILESNMKIGGFRNTSKSIAKSHRYRFTKSWTFPMQCTAPRLL